LPKTAKPLDRKLTILAFLIIFSCASPNEQRSYIHQGFAHNDYQHENPWDQSRDLGFRAIEVDLLLHNGRLLVGHELKDTLNASSFNDLYLSKIKADIKNRKLMQNNKGPVYLMLDFKTPALPTMLALQREIRSINKFISNHDGYKWNHREILLFISGNRPIELLKNSPLKRIFLDGRPSDLETNFDPIAMPVVSDRFSNWSKWNGKGQMPEEEQNAIRDLAKECHEKGTLLRLWAIPDNPEGWRQLIELGVDFINTDNLQGFVDWQLSYQHEAGN
jgi:hypothetical protein